MIDNVLQSFCERCGRRFTQPAPAERPAPAPGILGRLRRRPDAATLEPDPAGSPVAEAFRDTFHFCLECRRYNCIDCWNVAEGHCLSCRPVVVPAAAPTASVPTASRVTPVPGTAPDGPTPGAPTSSAAGGASADAAPVWPSDDLRRGSVSPSAPAPFASRESAAVDGDRAWADESDAGSAIRTPGAFSGGAARDVPEVLEPLADGADDRPWGAGSEALDPWRGVVFSADEVDRPTRSTPATSEPARTPAARPLDWPAPAVSATPAAPAASTVPAAPPATLPAASGSTAPVDEIGVLGSLIESEPHVDAAGWARASSAVVGLGSLKAATGTQVATGDATATGGEPAETDREASAGVTGPAVESDAVVGEGPAFVVELPVAEEAQRSDEDRAADELPVAEEAQHLDERAHDDEIDVAARLATLRRPAVDEETDAAMEPAALSGVDEAVDSGATVVAQEPIDVLSDHLAERDEQPAIPQVPSPAQAPEPDAAPSRVTAATVDIEPSLSLPEAPEQAASLPVADDLGQLGPPRTSEPLAPLPGLEVWVTPIEQGPFAQPYQPSPPQATVYPADVGHLATAMEPAAPATLTSATSSPAAPSEPPRMPTGTTAFAPEPPVVPPVQPPVPPVQPPAPPAPPAQPPVFAAAKPPTPPVSYPSAPAPIPPPPSAQWTAAPPPATWQPPPEIQPAPPVPRTPGPPARPAAAGSRACPNCALPLSTKARFCRRCGAPQPA